MQMTAKPENIKDKINECWLSGWHILPLVITLKKKWNN